MASSGVTHLPRPSNGSWAGRLFIVGLPVFSVVMSYLLPAVFYWYDVEYLTNPLMKPEFIEQATWYAAGAIGFYMMLVLLFPAKTMAESGVGWGAGFQKVSPSVYTMSAIVAAVFCHLLYVLSMGGYAELLAPLSRFYVELPWVKTLGMIFGLLSVIIYGLLGPGRGAGLFILAANAAIYSFSISSRSSSVFFLMASLICLSRKRWLAGTSFFVVAVLVYVDAIVGRSTLGLGRILAFHEVLGFIFDLSGVIFIFYDTFSALQTLTVAFSIGPLAQVSDWGSFLLYISPLPSSLMDIESFRQYQSLSYHMGIDVGINSDIMSESYLWFGWGGMLVAGGVYYLLYRVIRSRDWGSLYPLLIVGYVYFCVMSNVGSLRAASRPILYVVVIYFILKSTWRIAQHCSRIVGRPVDTSH